MQTALKEVIKFGLAETYYDSFMFDKVKKICDDLDAGVREPVFEL
jgi:hypothetical protein